MSKISRQYGSISHISKEGWRNLALIAKIRCNIPWYGTWPKLKAISLELVMKPTTLGGSERLHGVVAEMKSFSAIKSKDDLVGRCPIRRWRVLGGWRSCRKINEKSAARDILMYFQPIWVEISVLYFLCIHIETICNMWESTDVVNITYSLVMHLLVCGIYREKICGGVGRPVQDYGCLL